MKKITTLHISSFQKKILNRYASNKRDFPRRDSFNPYRVLVSEVMSQQTQIWRILPKFELFISELPTIEDLANCKKSDLLRLRSGLWFNSRALRLQQAAKIIVHEYGGIVPNNRETLLTLPGLGAYSSASICAFAYNTKESVIDTNIRRVLIRELKLPLTISKKDLEEIAFDCVPEWLSNDRHNALMDYGSLVCTAKLTWIKSLSKQSRFKGSDREVRWRVLKQLTKKRKLNESLVAKQFPNKEIKSILRWMQTDALIHVEESAIEIAS